MFKCLKVSTSQVQAKFWISQKVERYTEITINCLKIRTFNVMEKPPKTKIYTRLVLVGFWGWLVFFSGCGFGSWLVYHFVAGFFLVFRFVCLMTRKLRTSIINIRYKKSLKLHPLLWLKVKWVTSFCRPTNLTLL